MDFTTYRSDYRAALAQERQLVRALRELDHLPHHSHTYRVRILYRNRLAAELAQLQDNLDQMGSEQPRAQAQSVRWHHIDQMSRLERLCLTIDGHLGLVALWLRGRQATVLGWGVVAVAVMYLVLR